MRAIISNKQSGILRVESPPISEMTVSGNIVNAKIRFAFDAVKVVQNGGTTVRLELKKSENPAVGYSSVNDSINFSTVHQAERTHFESTKNISVKVFRFNVFDKIPDDKIESLRSGNLIDYPYWEISSSGTDTSLSEIESIDNKSYLIGNLNSGIDPASLKETFPIPALGSTFVNSTNSFYTRQVGSPNLYSQKTLSTSYIIFERTVQINIDDFLLSSIYEFSYIDKDTNPIEFVSVSVDPASLLNENEKLSFSSINGTLTEFDSYNRISATKVYYSKSASNIYNLLKEEYVYRNYDRDSGRPQITRTHYQSDRSTYFVESFVFKSKVYKLPNSTTSSCLIPFYVKPSLNDDHEIIIKNLPFKTRRVEIFVNGRKHTESRVEGQFNQKIPITLSYATHTISIVAITSKNTKIKSYNSITYENKRPTGNVSFLVTSPIVNENGNVSFKIKASFINDENSDIRRVVKILLANGVTQDVIDQIVSNPEYYSQIFSYRVEKINFLTGEQSYSSEGAITPGVTGTEYVDLNTNSENSAYVVSLGLRSPDALVSSQSTWKWKKTSLPSSSSQQNRTDIGSFFKVDSGIKTVVESPPANDDALKKISNILVSETSRNSFLIEWAYDGSTSNIDHFQIFGAADGVECLLGCSFKVLRFEDKQLYNRVGIVKYSIRPVYLDFSVGQKSSISILKRKTLPSILDIEFSNGQSWKQQETIGNGSFELTQRQDENPTRRHDQLGLSFTSEPLVSNLIKTPGNLFKSAKLQKLNLQLPAQFEIKETAKDYKPVTPFTNAPKIDDIMIIDPTERENLFATTANITKTVISRFR